MPAADEVWRLQNRDGAECELFRTIAEQGHYAGRTVPTDTRQGIYATTPSGTLLASCNTRSTGRIIEMLEEALARWEAMPEADRYLAPQAAADDGPMRQRLERLYPHDGLVLLVTSRDLPREIVGDDRREPRRRGRGWKRDAWNHDYAWFRKSEVRALVPRRREVEATAAVPDTLAHRLARLHLVDNVRGQTSHFEQDQVERAELVSRIVEIRDGELVLELDGSSRTVAEGRGVDLRLLGRATFDTSTGRFTAFELVAIGERWGGTRYNARERDGGPHGIGFALTLARDDPPVAPAFLWKYGWR